MKRKLVIIFSFLLIHVFATHVYYGDQPILISSEGWLLKWDRFVELLKYYFERMGFEQPTLGNVGDFNYIVWNGHTVGYDSASKFVSLDGVSKRSEGIDLLEALKVFGLPFVLEQDRLILPNTWIHEIQKVQDVIEISYSGEKRLSALQDGGYVYFKSEGYVFYGNVMYRPGQILAQFERASNESIKQQIDLKGLIRLVMAREISVSSVRFLELSENVVVSENELTVLYAPGDNRVIIRPYVPEYDGADWPVYAEVRKIAEKLCQRFSLKLEICPLIVLPPQTMTMLILVEDQALLDELKGFLEDLVR
ncbi:hypothetical protein AJ81_00215 [Pseudothermotoga hypogea DSM 11164 = NBRC 106472]|uniref:DUF4941 domain-containing protein n=1 Tax=Pseudothermotoga hypogea DSM 11164 = NBRC 106472 TaxID=1123384 RepID=A0A0X1KTM6_9THEM|nr:MULTISPECIES: DUF4941 domain-containing protein [Pseudothermotoga]AJC74601.1 hypothetical protein AJ81_00215 [Pseudothermotoga hypogea DSM 11164 = NBRC 106472]MDI6863808.1 DUF4941 domain-containing protein [Pseudothermotoga sp.]